MNDFDEESYGTVPVYLDSSTPLYLVMQQHQGHWGFPKGHPEGDETPQETAIRELREEVGIKEISLVEDWKAIDTYKYTKEQEVCNKRATYFLGITSETQTTLDAQEVIQCEWMPYTGAKKQLTFSESEDTLKKAKEYLEEK